MRILAKTCAILGMCLVMAGSALAGRGPNRSARGPVSDRRMDQQAKAVELLRRLAASGYLPGAQPAGDAKQAEEPVPFVALVVSDKPLYLGEVCGPGLHEVGGQVTAHVVANCPFHVLASFDGLRHQRSHVEMLPKDLTATINGKGVSIGSGRVPIISQGPTTGAGVDVPIDLQVAVKTVAAYPAGRYRGTLVLTITPGH